MCPLGPRPVCEDWTPVGQGQTYASPLPGLGHGAEGPEAMGTLMSLMGAAGQRPSILTRPVEVVGWAPTDLTPQGVGATLGYYAPSWLHLDHQWGFGCWGSDSRGHSEGRSPACGIVSDISALQKTGVHHPGPCPSGRRSPKFPRLPASPITLTQGHGPLTLQQAPAPLHIGVTHITGGTSVRRNRDQLCQALENPCVMVDLGSQEPSGLPSMG